MINFFKNLFGSKPVETVAEVPYKVEAVVTPIPEAIPVATEVKAPAKKPAVKQPAAKTPTSKKPRKPRAPKVAK